jgi:hypothetical protein
MKWMKERDLLIAQTLAFVQSVTGKRPDAVLSSPATEMPPAPITTAVVNVEAVLAEPAAISLAVAPDADQTPATQATLAQATPAQTTPPEIKPSQATPLQIAGLDLPGDFQSEIRARVASFRAHQERFTREREEYCRATMAKVRASLIEDTESPRSAG